MLIRLFIDHSSETDSEVRECVLPWTVHYLKRRLMHDCIEHTYPVASRTSFAPEEEIGNRDPEA